MLILTGAAGFIGSVVAGHLIRKEQTDLILVDDFTVDVKRPNWEAKENAGKVQRDKLESFLAEQADTISAVIHLGARTDTAEQDKELFDRLNVNYSKMIWTFCTKNQIPLVYASSAATYGGGELGFVDDHSLVDQLRPLNPYGESKNEFDQWVLEQDAQPPFWAGLKFFNVYGPNEWHKGRMASVILHAFRQISATGGLKLFRSHRDEIEDGHQERDFIFVKDIANVIDWLLSHRPKSGIYNLGTGKARTFLDLGKGVFKALGKEEKITFIDTPADIRDTYQYFTEADMSKLRNEGYSAPFTTLEDGIDEYVKQFLAPHVIY